MQLLRNCNLREFFAKERGKIPFKSSIFCIFAVWKLQMLLVNGAYECFSN